MLSLDERSWNEMKHALGAASDVPRLLVKLQDFPLYLDYRSEPYYSLWNRLCHQGDVYPASYAAVPHIVRILKENPKKAHWNFLLLPASIELARVAGRGPELSPELAGEYRLAFEQLPSLALLAGDRENNRYWDEVYCRVMLGAVAVAKGQASLAEAIFDLTPQSIDETSAPTVETI